MKSLDDCDRIFLLHMRKAAGTSLRRFFGELCQLCGLDLEVVEGWPFDAARLDEERTWFVTSLRDPFERVCSLYNFEGRWPQADTVRAPESAVPFGTWFEMTEPREPAPRHWLWSVACEHYTKTLGGFGPFRDGVPEWRFEPDNGVSVENYRQAVRVLERFDLVLICEWLEHESYRRCIANALVGADQLPVELPHSNRTAERKPAYDLREHMTPAVRRRIEAGNRWDRELYRVACMQSSARLRWNGVRTAAIGRMPASPS